MSTSKPLTDRQAALATPSFSRTDLEAIDRALSKTIAHLVAFANTTPYLDDPRWSPWTRFQKPLADRCDAARAKVRATLSAQED
jgi:hypothetical protein